jgi:hypothetical protein
LERTNKDKLRVENLVNDQTYGFRIRSINQCLVNGNGRMSDLLVVELSGNPGQMAPVNTSLNNCALQIDWIAPQDGGSDITGYTIEIQGS